MLARARERTSCLKQMFDWNDQDQVGDTIWGEFNESEDHIVPNPKGSEENTLSTFGEYSKKQKTEEVSSVVRSAEQRSGDKNEASEPNTQGNSDFNGNDELSASRLDMDIWPELPSLNAALCNGYNVQNDEKPLETGLLTGSSEASTTTNMRVQLGEVSELFGGQHEDKESDSFLGCDWGTIGDFDDLDRIFRNSDSIFVHEMVGSADEFLAPSSDLIDGAAQSIPVLDIPAASEDKSSDQGCSSYQLEHYDGKVQSEKKKIEVKTEQPESQHHLTSEYGGMSDQSSEKVDGQRKLLKSWNNTEEKSKKKATESVKASWSTSMHLPPQVAATKFLPALTNSTQVLQSPTISQQTNALPVCHPSFSGRVMFSGYRCPPYPHAAIADMPHIHAERNQKKPVSIGQKNHPDLLKHSQSVKKRPGITKTQGMTPQAKIEKLRRRHQMQAMIAIQQQQQQLSHQKISGTENSVSQGSFQKNQTQEAIGSTNGYDENPSKLPSVEGVLEADELQIDDHSLAETIYNQLQDALDKLDIRVRLRMRDSLLRLARSSTERQNATDRSSTNRSNRNDDDVLMNDEKKNQDRSSTLSDAETHTNPIDRTVAHLLFHRPSESCMRTMKDDIPNSPVSSNPVSKPYPNNNGSASSEQPGN